MSSSSGSSSSASDDEQPPSSPGSSSSTSDEEQPVAAGVPAEDNHDEVDPIPLEERVDGSTRRAGPGDQRTVYMWSFPHTDREGRAKPGDFTRQTFALVVVEAYSNTGKIVVQWACFLEVHPTSRSELEQHAHFHFIAQTDRPCRWGEIAQYLRTHHRIYASASTSSGRRSYWTAFSYLFTPSLKKPKDDLDNAYVLSPGHEDPPNQLLQRRQGIRRVQPVEVYDTIIQHGLDSVLKLYAFAARQRDAGDVSWLQFCLKQNRRKLKELIESATTMSTASSTLSRMSLSHMDVLISAGQAECICEGHAIPGWQHILYINNIDEAGYIRSVRMLFETGGGKGVNHFYVGDPNTGKTALTRPLLALFGKYAFVKPQVSTTFALQGLIGAQALIWNDFRWPHPPLSWGDMLNVLDNEPFNIAVPKVDGDTDYHWNSEGKENVIAVLTSNVPVVFISGNAVNEMETAAWNERFGKNVWTFRTALASPDKRYKRWFQCTRCYADWVLGGTETQSQGSARDAEGPQLPVSQVPTEPETPAMKRVRSGHGPNSGPNGSGGLVSDGALPVIEEAPPFPISGGASAGSEPEAAAVSQSSTVVPSVAAVVAPQQEGSTAASFEPMRELNTRLKRSGLTATWSDVLSGPSTGTWTCEIRAGAFVGKASAPGKKAARRAAALDYLRLAEA